MGLPIFLNDNRWKARISEKKCSFMLRYQLNRKKCGWSRKNKNKKQKAINYLSVQDKAIVLRCVGRKIRRRASVHPPPGSPKLRPHFTDASPQGQGWSVEDGPRLQPLYRIELGGTMEQVPEVLDVREVQRTLVLEYLDVVDGLGLYN